MRDASNNQKTAQQQQVIPDIINKLTKLVISDNCRKTGKITTSSIIDTGQNRASKMIYTGGGADALAR